ncbi:MAG: HD domain-containing protein [Vicinamibacterales bacterium]
MFQTDLGRVDAVLAALDLKRPHVAAHSRRVSAYSVRLAVQFGLADDVVETIRLGALLHDVGKMLTPSRILEKPGRPNAREWQELKIHPELGAEICHRSGFDDEVCAIVLHHHERCDGSGYPDKLAHPAIPYTVRIVAVMDTFDALTSSRDYRDRLSVPAARTLIARAAGAKYCPWVVSGLLALPVEMLQPWPGHAPDIVRHAEGPAVLPMTGLAGFQRPASTALHASLC